jgi:hypothetical protein
MIPAALALIPLVLTAGPRARSHSDAVAKEARFIPIDDKRHAKIYRIRTALTYPTTIEFPEDFLEPPACGDCADKDTPPPARGELGPLFRIDVYEKARYLTIKPRVPAEEARIPRDDFITNLTVRLEHVTLTLQVEYSDLRHADARVVFTMPNRAADAGFVAIETARQRAKLEQEFAGKVDRGVTEAFLRALSGPHHCSSLSSRSRNDDLVLWVREICSFARGVYIKFGVENRARLPADIGDVTVKQGQGSASMAAVMDPQEYLSTRHIEFRDTATGIIGIRLADGEEPARRYDLIVNERGGKGRELAVSGFGF